MLLEVPGILLLYRGSMNKKRHQAREAWRRPETRRRRAGAPESGYASGDLGGVRPPGLDESGVKPARTAAPARAAVLLCGEFHPYIARKTNVKQS